MSNQKKEYKPLELKPGDGKLFKNNEPKSELSPQYMGEIEIPADMVGRAKVSLWKKTSKAGNVYLSLSLWKPTPRASEQKPKATESSEPDFNDDIPF